jgi:undecaprenyl-diphosphatase
VLADWQAAILGVVQGLSEPLPISSSGHLVLVPWLFGWADVGEDSSFNRTFDVSLHIGTLLGVVAYFRHDIMAITAGAWRSVRRRSLNDFEERLPWYILLGTVPAVVIGGLFASVIDEHMASPALVGVQLILFGILLFIADRYMLGSRVMERIDLKDSAFVGVAQAVSLMPGVSRSGITITAGLARGYRREAAARFSFLLSVPAVFGAVVYKGYETFVTGDGLPPGAGSAFFWGILTSTISGYLAIWFLLRYVRNHSFLPFVIYRCSLGVIVLAVVVARM